MKEKQLEVSPNNEIFENHDEEQGKKRNLVGSLGLFAGIIAFVFGIFQLFTGGYQPLKGLVQYAVHIGFSLVLIFLYFPGRKKSSKHVTLLDVILIALGLATVIYVIPYNDQIFGFTFKESVWQTIFGTILLVLILEASRRTMGWIFPILVGFSVVYALFGHLIPGDFGHSQFAFKTVIESIYFSPNGLWGLMLQISSTLLAVFLVFGSVLLQTGGGDAFLDIAILASSRTRGGPAKVAAVASGLFGMISGSAVANAATIGSFTIPLMKRAGFTAEFAAASEGVAGTGGQLMPPIMGAGAFLIAQFMGVSYAKVAIAAIIPAILYYAGLIFSIHLESLKNKMEVPHMDEMKQIISRLSFRRTVLPLLPVAILIYYFVRGYTVQVGAFWSAIISLVVYWFRIEGKWDLKHLKEFAKGCYKSFEGAGISIAQIAVLLASAQILVAMLGLTGVAVKFSDLLVQVGQTSVLATMVLGMVVLIILGMGIPPTAVYVVGASILVPALTLVGVKPMPAHLFTFYFSSLGAITPPVCAAIYVTSAVAKSDWWKSGWLAVRLGLAGFIVPFAFVYKDTLLLYGSYSMILLDVTMAALGVLLLAGFATGYFRSACSWVERVLLLVAGVLLVFPGWTTDIIGIVIALAIFLIQYRRSRSLKAA